MEKTEISKIRIIGSKDTGYTAKQYNKHGDLYIKNNPYGLRGGFTPDVRLTRFEEIALTDDSRPLRVFEAGFGPGYEAVIAKNRGHDWHGGDVTWRYIDNLRAKGIPAIYFDAGKDSIPEGFDAFYAHLVLFHIRPQAVARLMASARENLEGPKAFYASFLDGRGHERNVRNEEINRDFVYYPEGRLLQLCHQEGLVLFPDTESVEKVVAFNKSVFWHIRGKFLSKDEYHGGSYGAKDLHPFGDNYWVPNSLCDKDPTIELVEAQVKDGFLSPETAELIKTKKRTLLDSIITYNEIDKTAKEINEIWAEGLEGQEISKVMQHAMDHFDQQPHFRRLIESALAVGNNNGFSNILVGFEPSWMLEVLSKRFGLDHVVPSVQWRTQPGTHFTGKITGSVFYVDDAVNPKSAVLRHQSNLRRKLNSPYKRYTVGIGQSIVDASFLAETDYPILASPTRENTIIAENMGYFINRHKEPILVDNKPWNRWKVTKDELDLIKHLDTVTSDRFPIRPTRSDFIVKRLWWTCPSSHLKGKFYTDSIAPIQISET